jgi:hypothetical protein
MKNSSFNYGFMLSLHTRNLELDKSFISFYCPELPRLNFSNSLTKERRLSADLEAVVKGERDERRWGGGDDFFHVVSKQEISTVYQADRVVGGDLKYNETEVPTAILLKMVKDWVLFLESIPKELLGKRTIE